MRILGVIFDENMSWCHHVNKVVSGCNLTLRSLYPIQKLLSTVSKKIVISALVLSQINFASILWLRQSNYKIIDLLIKKCARYVFNLLKYDSVTELVCTQLGWLFSKYHQQFETLKLAYKVVNNIGPLYFRNYLTSDTIEGVHTRQRQYITPSIQSLTTFGRETF
jgi:hypothetical protein